jgi:hypothetical protein
LVAERNAIANETVQLRDAAVKARTEAEKAVQEATLAKAQLLKHDADWEQKLEMQTKRVRQAEGSLTAIAVELEHRQQEVNYQKQLIAQRDDKLKGMVSEVEASRARAVDMELAAKAEQQRNESLLAELERKEKTMQHQEVAAAPGMPKEAGPKHNPPAEDVEGLIKALDPQSGLVTITIGSDAGLSKGNTLEVFRLKPEATYLGQLEILAVRPNEAVGRPLVRTRGNLQVGDRVASNILNRR